MPPRVVALLFSLAVISYFDRTVLSIAAPSIMREFGLGEVQMGWVLSAFLWSYALCQIPGGRFADIHGPRKTLAAMAGGSGLFTALMAAGNSAGAFAALRLGFGVATAPLFPAVNRANASWSLPAQRSLVQGLVASGAGLGSALSPLAVSWIVEKSGWRAAFVFAGALAMAAGWIWWRFAGDPPSAPPPEVARGSWRALLGDKSLLLLTLGFTALDYYEYIFFYWIYYYLGEVRKIPPRESAVYTTILFLAWLVMAPLGGWAAARMSRAWGRKTGMRAAAMGSMAGSAVSLFVGVSSEDVTWAVVFISLAFGFAASADVNYWAATIDVMGARAGAAGGVLNGGGNLGGAVGPVLTPMIASWFGWSAGLYFGAALALAGALIWLFIDFDKHDHPPATLH